MFQFFFAFKAKVHVNGSDVQDYRTIFDTAQFIARIVAIVQIKFLIGTTAITK